MGNKADRRRRWIGAVFLLAALGMLVAGETVLRDRLSPFAFLVFWFLCFLFTCLAILIAFLDVSIIRRRAREEQRAFLESTIKEIARSKKSNSRKGEE